MADYQYKNDGKLHTRYSELIRCTPGQIDRVLDERSGLVTRFEGDSMLDGTMRHEMWQEEAEKSLQVPKCFGLDWPVTHVEHEFATEILPGVIVHSRPDLVCGTVGIVPDYKTVVDGVNGWQKNLKSYGWRPVYDKQGKIIGDAVVPSSKQRQLKFYAYQVGLHGIRIKEGAFLCEIWNKDHTAILDYKIVRFPITMKDMREAIGWAKPRIALLTVALEDIKHAKV